MSINQLKKCFLLTAIALLCAFGSNAQEAFEKGKLYHIYGAGEKENLVAEKMGETATGISSITRIIFPASLTSFKRPLILASNCPLN